MLNLDLKLNEGIFSTEVEKKSTRQGFGDAIIEAAKNDNNLVVLCGDLKESLRLETFANQFPKRYIEVGIAEQNMVSIAAGMASTNKVPFTTSLAIFNPGRSWEQIRLSVCYSNLNVKIVGSHSGLSHSADGGMAQCLEDIALMRVLPNMIVVHPGDYDEAYKATLALAAYKGPAYLRLTRENTPRITTKESPFEIGKAYVLKEGSDITLLATGTMIYEALAAAKDLKGKYQIDAEVINFPTIKPLDEKTLLSSAKKTNKVITIEDHQVAGGFGSAVSEFMSEHFPIKVIKIGVQDVFGESGTYSELKDKYGLSPHHIVEKALSFFR